MRVYWSVLGLLFVSAACTGSGPGPVAAEQDPAESAPTAEVATAAATAATQASAEQPETSPGGLTLVTEADQVCMVNNQFMGRDQIPVEFEGRTYYGCCAGCVTRIQNDPAVRAAIDPVTGRAVDKSSAVMGQDSEGNILYFESAESFSEYGSRT